MAGVADLVATLLLLLSLGGCIYTIAAAVLVGRFKALPLPDLSEPLPGITVLKPLHGLEPRLAENLETLLRQRYPGPVQIVFGVSDADDPAVEVVRSLQAQFRDADIRLVIDARQHGSNAKVSNVINITRAARHPLLVLADSDVAWPADTLVRLALELAEPGTGLVSCLHFGRGDAGPWSQLAAMDISYRFLPSVVVGIATGLATPCLGPTLALSSATLDRIGGFEAFADMLADDYEIGRAVRGLGLATTVPRFTICHSGQETTVRALVAHELRWTRTIYGIDPAGFAGSLLTHPLPLALVAALLAGFDALSLAVLLCAATCRLALMMRVEAATGWAAGTNPLAMLMLPVRDIVSASVFVATFFVKDVIWRETRYRVKPNGEILRL
jgi:ceramide glucosyltransferase